MQIRVSRWGSDLGGRIPREMAEAAGLKEGSWVQVVSDEDTLIDTQCRARYRLEDLLRGMSRQSMQRAFDWDED